MSIKHKESQLQRDTLNLGLSYMQHLSPHIVVSFRHWDKHSGCRSTVRCCQHWEGWLPSYLQGFWGVFSLATPFPAVQLRSTECSKLCSKKPRTCSLCPPLLTGHPLFKRPTTAPGCESTVRAHPPLMSLSQLPSAQVLPAFYSLLHEHWQQKPHGISHSASV